ncbi:hypothetical protein UT300005_05840 [Clostridium sp. CTA-5]
MEENKIKVYIKIDKNNCITNVDSSIFIQDITDWIYIDEGYGDKYALAQNNYFPKEKPLRDMQGRCNYKLVNNKPVELTEQEKEQLFLPIPPVPTREEILQKQLLETQDLVLQLQEQILLNNK